MEIAPPTETKWEFIRQIQISHHLIYNKCIRQGTGDVDHGSRHVDDRAGGTQRLARLVGVGRAKELIYTGRIITAEEAKLIGLVNQVTGDTREELMEAAKAMAEQIMKKGPVATRLAKMAINVGMDTDINTGLLFERIAQTVAFGTEDRKEGTQAFLEKRKAEFKGC